MKGFKGTPGPWEVYNGWNTDGVKSEEGEFICRISRHLTDKEKANAQLISKAPELLDFINRISGEMLRNDFVLSEKWYEQAKQLIQEATT